MRTPWAEWSALCQQAMRSTDWSAAAAGAIVNESEATQLMQAAPAAAAAVQNCPRNGAFMAAFLGQPCSMPLHKTVNNTGAAPAPCSWLLSLAASRAGPPGHLLTRCVHELAHPQLGLIQTLTASGHNLQHVFDVWNWCGYIMSALHLAVTPSEKAGVPCASGVRQYVRHTRLQVHATMAHAVLGSNRSAQSPAAMS